MVTMDANSVVAPARCTFGADQLDMASLTNFVSARANACVYEGRLPPSPCHAYFAPSFPLTALPVRPTETAFATQSCPDVLQERG